MYTSGAERSRISFTFPLRLKPAGGLFEVHDLPQPQHYVQHSQAAYGSASVTTLHRKRQPRPMHLVGGQNKQVVFTPGRTGKPGENHQQNANLETDENEKD